MQNECSDRAQTDDHKELGDLVVAPSTPDISSAPDEHTKKERSFFDGAAPNQVFRLHLYFVSYGTDDKSHAASLILSIMLGLLLLVLFGIGAFVDKPWIPDALQIIGTAFTFTAGVAIGKSATD